MDHLHPGKHLQQELTSKGLTQKELAVMIGKKISEVNELIKGKRNITVQRDILLSIVFDHPEKKWIQLQNEFDFMEARFQMSEKIKEVQSKKKKSKGHEVFEDF